MAPPTLSPPDRAAIEAYDAMAPVYDAFTAHHRHDVWTDMLERLLRPLGLPVRGRLLDVGCGTGKSFVPWQERGWSVVACDASPPMLAHAAMRAKGDTVTLVADGRDLAELGAFDLVTMTDDVANCLAPEDLAAAFGGAARHLAPGGLLAFDVNTLRMYRTFFAGTEVHEADGLLVLWRGGAPVTFRPGDAAEADLDAFVALDGGWQRRRAVHRQRHHPVALLAEALEEAGLEVVAVHGVSDDCDLGALDELLHPKAVIVARRG